MQGFKKSYLFFLTLVLAVFLAACSDDSSDSSSSDNSTDNSTDNSGDTTASAGGQLILEVLSEAVELDPHGSNDVPSANVQANIYDTLVNRNFDTGEIKPGLAESWTQVDDLTLELKLRQGVKFHDGTDFNAEAVKINLDRLLDPTIASPRASTFEPISEVIVVDDYTVQIKTEAPYGPLLATLTHPGGYMISPAVIAEDYENMKNGGEPRAIVNEKPVGTGFLKFESWQAGQQINLVKNEDYWGGAVAYNSAVFKTIPESATRAADLEAGYAHIIDPVQPIEVENVKSFANIVEQPSVSVAYIGFNTEKAPLDNLKLRQAISKAVDRDTIIQGIFEGYGTAAFGPMAPNTWGYNEDIVKQDYNMEESKALMKESGVATPLKLNLWTNDNPQRIQIATIMQEKLKELDIELNVEVLEWGAYLEKTAGTEHDLFILGWSPSTADADNAINPLFNTADIGNNNRTRFSNAELDELLKQGQQETDEATRMEIYKKAQDIINENVPAAFVYHQAYLTGYSNSVSGFTIDATGIYRLKDVKISE
jgi:peptide/nickel transport system substrate-binding protein